MNSDYKSALDKLHLEQGKKEEVGGDYCITIENDKRI